MQVLVTLVRRELGGYFASLTGYVIIGAVLFILGLCFSDMLPKLNAEPTEAPLTEQFFVTLYFWIILLLTAPVMTMRSFASEKFSGVYETLMTAPVKDLEVVLGKFIGALIFYTLTWLPLLGMLVFLRRFSNEAAALDPGVLGCTFLGILLIGSVYMSLGCLASALTRSQIIAAILSYAMGIMIFVLSLRSLSSAPDGWQGKLFGYISVTEHMQDFARGTIDTRHLMFYISLTALFLFLTLKVVESRRWK